MKTGLILSFLILFQVYADENWPRFRGIDGQGKSSSTLPKKLSKSNLKWSFKLSGGGSSSPVVWGNKIFIQSSNENKSVTLYCLDAQNGKKLWSHELNTGAYHTHKFNNQAASTPSLTENEVIVTWYDASKQQGMLGVFDHSGKKL
ncbi:MAG: PQQ-binding-like beta-propeller repeat protein, partial [Lentisphaeraceae bacterium]|nr:PQQ-binding-like beta-propeller repeat protein [Lentisphaeraceae bacterium]